MNLFDLFVRIGVKDETTEQVSQIKATTIAAGHLMADAVKATGKAVVNLGQQAIQGYAETEQLRGGVETLFKESADIVKGYAENAYKDAGMSANEYMNTVTGFSASLLNSLGGDTAAAAEYANRAVVSMSDNANKMGTDISMIQNAYQGFAKQNYTMLDNLKLGYGGTKQEMERLIEDAAKMTDVQERLGITVDSSSMSFDNIVNAIQVMQENMGIAGATAAEAESTISGSAASMKAAWENLVAGLADENANVDELLNRFLESVKVAAGNVLPVIQTTLSNIGQTLEENGPEMIASGAVLLAKLALGLVKAIPDVVGKIPEIVEAVVDAFQENGPEFEKIGEEIVRGLWEGIKNLGGWLSGKVTGFFGDLVADAKDFLGIHSPSRMFAGIGENMALGLGQGWDNEYDSIQRGITSGLDFGAATVGVGANYTAQQTAVGGEREIVINLTAELDGQVVARKLHRYNREEDQRHGPSFVMA